MAAGGSSAWAGMDENVDCAKDMTVSKESGEDWADDPLIDLRADSEAGAVAVSCKYNYCCVHKSSFPLGYERSMSHSHHYYQRFYQLFSFVYLNLIIVTEMSSFSLHILL